MRVLGTGLLHTPLTSTMTRPGTCGGRQPHTCWCLVIRKATSSWAEESATQTSLLRPLVKRPQFSVLLRTGTNMDRGAPQTFLTPPAPLPPTTPGAWLDPGMGLRHTRNPGARPQPCPTANHVTPPIPPEARQAERGINDSLTWSIFSWEGLS